MPPDTLVKLMTGADVIEAGAEVIEMVEALALAVLSTLIELELAGLADGAFFAAMVPALVYVRKISLKIEQVLAVTVTAIHSSISSH